MIKITFSELCRKKDWKQAVIVFKKEVFKEKYPLHERSYEILSNVNYFNSEKRGNSLYGYCLDRAVDQGVRIDTLLRYKNNCIEYCYVTYQKVVS